MLSDIFHKTLCLVQIIILSTFYLVMSIIAVSILLIVRFILRPFRNKRFRFTRSIKRYWLNITVSIFQFFLPAPIYVSYNKDILLKNRLIIISNHLTNWDWLILLVVLKELKMYDQLCIIMKESLKKIPLFGYGMKCFGYIFLKRNWIQDSSILHDGIYDLKKKNNFQILIFPEGTFLDQESHEKLNEYSEKHKIIINEEIYKPYNSLIPRTRGINEIRDALSGRLEGIIDITMFITPYKRHLADQYSFTNILFKKVEPPRFMFIIDEIKDIRSKDWLYQTFSKKEKFLSELVHLHSQIHEIESLAQFTTYTNNILKKKQHAFEKRIKTRWFSIYFFVFLLVCYFFISTRSIYFS